MGNAIPKVNIRKTKTQKEKVLTSDEFFNQFEEKCLWG